MNHLKDEVIHYNEKLSYALLVTVGEENRPFARHVGPFANDGLDIFFITLIGSRKAKHINRNPFVIVYFQDLNQTQKLFKSVALSGSASRMPEGKEFVTVLEKMGQKSPYFMEWIKNKGTKGWAIYKIKTNSLQYNDLTKPERTIEIKV